MSRETFKQRVNKNHKCPKCNSHIIFIHGGGWDYDRECDYKVEYETTTDIKENKDEV